MFFSAHAAACDFVSCTTPPLLAAYAGAYDAPKIDSLEPTLITLPVRAAAMLHEIEALPGAERKHAGSDRHLQ